MGKPFSDEATFNRKGGNGSSGEEIEISSDMPDSGSLDRLPTGFAIQSLTHVLLETDWSWAESFLTGVSVIWLAQGKQGDLYFWGCGNLFCGNAGDAPGYYAAEFREL
jgi:hypothetical protein